MAAQRISWAVARVETLGSEGGSREMELGLLAGLVRAGRCGARAGISSRLRLTLPHWTLASHQ